MKLSELAAFSVDVSVMKALTDINKIYAKFRGVDPTGANGQVANIFVSPHERRNWRKKS